MTGALAPRWPSSSSGQADCRGLGKSGPQCLTEFFAAAGPGQQESGFPSGRQRGQKVQTGDYGTNLVVYRRPAFVVQLAYGYIKSPVVAAQMTK
jgi:hypothetical protein